MPTNDRYVHGDFNVISDRSGFKLKRSECRREWNGLLVGKDEWEPRHPQDFVRGVKDDQSVPDPRPGAVDNDLDITTTLDADEIQGQTVLSVTSTTNFSAGAAIIVHLDNSRTHLSTISSFVANDTVTIDDGLPSKASSGARVLVVKTQIQSSDL